jgi:hypothetical protein
MEPMAQKKMQYCGRSCPSLARNVELHLAIRNLNCRSEANHEMKVANAREAMSTGTGLWLSSTIAQGAGLANLLPCVFDPSWCLCLGERWNQNGEQVFAITLIKLNGLLRYFINMVIYNSQGVIPGYY